MGDRRGRWKGVAVTVTVAVGLRMAEGRTVTVAVGGGGRRAEAVGLQRGRVAAGVVGQGRVDAGRRGASEELLDARKSRH